MDTIFKWRQERGTYGNLTEKQNEAVTVKSGRTTAKKNLN